MLVARYNLFYFSCKTKTKADKSVDFKNIVLL